MPNVYSFNGQLQIGTFYNNVGRPISNARVTISPHGNTEQVIDELITDADGQTPTVSLDAPAIDYSMEPQEEQVPYSEYDLTVSSEGYEPARIERVQILPNTIATQDIMLQPIERNEQPTQIMIEDNTLWGVFPPKIPEEPVKELPPSKNLVVLPDPVIPEFVIVHDGVPSDANAQNYWVPFKDYIKNVASCEVYATWPNETLIANILAILSFTLNRIYTEWYRNKGYNFTITNSTAYDHAFNYGRNIFDSISEVVDNIFTNFITKPGIRQPLFTQYCDGQRVQCPSWMSQWGSKYLGDQGYLSMDILKQYYGQDIYLMQAQKVEGVPTSFPGVNLQMGSTGSAVETIQEQLNAISNNYPLIPKQRVDGIFGDTTREAVEIFQQTFNLPSSGIVDFPTWYKISDVFVAVTEIAG